MSPTYQKATLRQRYIYSLGHKARNPEGGTTMRTRTFEKVPYTIFTTAARVLQMSEGKLIKAIGYSPSSHSGWRKAGLMPKVASVAIEGILYRKNLSSKDHSTLVVKAKNGNLDAVKSVLSALDCSFVEV